MAMGKEKQARHVLSLSGGKDSAALAIYMRDRQENMEYIFSDTGKELPETYEYLERIENFLGTQVIRLNADAGFDHWYEMYGGMIPSNHRRWCTRALKLKPFEKFCGDTNIINYVGLRAEEDRIGYISHKPNIKAVYPFREDGLVLKDIEEILQTSGVGMPPYTKWGRTRSGCFFCFYQQKIEWVRLLETHPDLFEQAEAYERAYEPTGNLFTWSQGEPLKDLRKPERMAKIKADAERRAASLRDSRANLTLAEVFGQELKADPDESGCLACSL